MVEVIFSAKAFIKAMSLVGAYDKEVGWHGTAQKIDDKQYRVDDILVYPQYTTGSFIDDEQGDPLEKKKWEDTLPDEIYNTVRLIGHSHVNMGVCPSGLDNEIFKERMRSVTPESIVGRFFISTIFNKHGEVSVTVFDADDDKVYGIDECFLTTEVEDGLTSTDYIESIAHMVKDLDRSKKAEEDKENEVIELLKGDIVEDDVVGSDLDEVEDDIWEGVFDEMMEEMEYEHE